MINPKIVNFINKHHLLTLATSCDNTPYCASCFFVFDKEAPCFIIATDEKTRHGREALLNPTVAGTIALETNMVGKIQGIQFSGIFRVATVGEKMTYFKRFPYALAMNPSLWSIDIGYIKFTDNTLGFGKKLEFFASN